MRRLIPASIVLLAIVAGIWRFVDLDRDPDIVTETSQELWSDPAWYLYNARSHALLGEWRVHEGGALYVAQGYSFLASAVFSVFGVTYANAEWMAILAGFLAIGATALLAGSAARSAGSSSAGARGAAAISLLGSYVICAQQRVPNGDMEALAVSTAAAACLAQIQSIDAARRPFAFKLVSALAGLGIALAPFVKLHNGIFSAAAVAAWAAGYFLLDDDWKAQWRKATPWIALGMAIGAAIWMAWFFWLFQSPGNQLEAQLGRLRIYSVAAAPQENVFPRSNVGPMRYFQSNLIYRQPLETALAALAFFVFLLRRKGSWPLLLLSVWWITGIAALMNMTMDPLRYRLIVWPAVVSMAASLWVSFRDSTYRPLQGVFEAVTAFGLGMVFGSAAVYLVNFKLGVAAGPAALMIYILAIGASFVCLRLLRAIPQPRIAWALAVLFVLMSVPQWIGGERQVSHELLNASRHFEKFPAETVFGGYWAVRLAFSSPRNAYFFWTTDALTNVSVIANNADTILETPLPWHELERTRLRRSLIDIEIVLGQIDR